MIPTVKRMVLFKHGVAYVERGGPAEGSFELSFAKDEMNDVLKSLSVWVEEGEATPTAIAFEKPESPETALDEKGLNLPSDKSLSALLTAMRGRQATVRAATAAGERVVRGEIVGIDTRPVDAGWRAALVLAPGRGALETIELDDVRGLVLEDGVAIADLDFLLERRRAASSHERRAVHVGVDGKAEDLRVAYIVPAPMWRVSYRVIRDTSGEKEKTVIAAWAIVHNPLDEDAKDVALTLTTGQPISFQIDLYHPKHVERVMVEETSRAIAAPPQMFERGGAMPMVAAAGPAAIGGFGGPPPAPRMAKGRAEAMMDSAQGAADGAAALGDRGELFEYRVQKPVTLKRGGSALVPLLTREVPARRERIWREGKPSSPDLVMAFPNTSGAVLEEGPAVIYDEGIYAGEAMVPYSARGSEVRFAFAKDLSVRCASKSRYDTVTVALRFGRGQAIEDQRQERRITLRADSDHDTPVEVIFELPKRSELDPRSPKPSEETAHTRRFTARVPERGFVELEVIEVSPVTRTLELKGLAARELDHWRRLDLLNAATDAVLSEALAAAAESAAHLERVSELEREKQEPLRSLEGLTKQLQVLKEGGAEGELRLRYVNDLRKNQDRVNALDAAMEEARRASADASQRAEQILTRLARP